MNPLRVIQSRFADRFFLYITLPLILLKSKLLMHFFKQIGWMTLLFSLYLPAYPGLCAQTAPSAAEIVNRMVEAETAAWKTRHFFHYYNDERSSRTNGHLWHEEVVETPDGSIERLLTEDGLQLSPARKEAEEERIAWLANHPAELRRLTQKRHENAARIPEFLRQVPHLYLFKTLSTQGDVTRIAFEPDPNFEEQSYQDRLAHAVAGTVVIHTPDMRIVSFDAHLAHKVEFGFGLLGTINESSSLTFTRAPVSPGQWTTTSVHFSLFGTILFMKSLSRKFDETSQDFQPIPFGITVAQAAALIHATPN